MRMYMRFGKVKSAEAASFFDDESFSTSAITFVTSTIHSSFLLGDFITSISWKATKEG